MDIFDLMAAPFAECLVLVGIHTYLGVHVLRRRVIFVDLALAQIAALGTTVGFLFGILPDSTAALIFSMAFAFIGAAVFAVTRIRAEKVPQEAIIGLVYAITCASSVLVVEKTQGAEHLKDILVGSLLWVQWSDVGIAAVAYAIVGIVHYALRDKFLLISENPDEAYRRGMSVRAWDFLFYMTFGFVIAFSVRVAGVLLVFVFLVAPAIMAFIITERLRYQLLIGWVMGTVVTVVGLYLSYAIDLPSGPTVVAFYGIALVVGSLAVFVIRAVNKTKALTAIGAGVGVTAIVSLLLYLGGTGLAATDLALSDAVRETEANIAQEATVKAPRAVARTGQAMNRLEAATKGCVTIGRLRAYVEQPDADTRLEFAKAELKTGRKKGLKQLLVFLSDRETPMFYRAEGLNLVRETAGQDFGYDADLEPTQNEPALNRFCQYLQTTTTHGLGPGGGQGKKRYHDKGSQ